MPNLEHLPYVGFRPVIPVKAAGCLMDPPVSVPSAIGAIPAATAAAEPPEEPPGVLSKSHGLFTFPTKLVSLEEPIANSSIFVLPSMTVPFSLKFLTTVASYGEIKFDNIFEPHVV